MYAVIKTGGKQYRVAADEVLTVEKLAGEAAAAMGRTANALTLRGGSMILRRDQAPEREYPGPA